MLSIICRVFQFCHHCSSVIVLLLTDHANFVVVVVF